MNQTTDVETTLCSVITKKGQPCKNRPQRGGTMCGPHAKLENQAIRFKQQSKIKPVETTEIPTGDELAEYFWDKAQFQLHTIDTEPETICISGSTNNVYPERTEEVLDRYFQQFDANLMPYVILGDAKGTDKIVANWLERQDGMIPYQIVKAKWETDGGVFRPSAGMERNEQMIRRSDRLLAFNHEGYGNGDSGFQPVDKGTTQAIEKAREAKLKVTVINLSKWEAEDPGDPPATPKLPPHIRKDQLIPAIEFDYRPSLITVNRPSWIYIGRGKANTAMQHPGMLALPRNTTHADFKRRVWQRITKREPHLLREFARITETTSLICDCEGDKHTCHGPVIISAVNFLNSDDGAKYRMTQREIKDYDAAHDPALLSTLPHSERVRIVGRFGTMSQKAQPKAEPRQLNGGPKLSQATPLVKNSRVIYINGDLELPAIVTHIEYGKNWTDDAYTGHRRKEILNCTLYNEPMKAHFIYSDSNSEMIRRGHRNSETGTAPEEEGILLTIAPYVKKVKSTKEISTPNLTTSCRIKSGMTIRILDRATGEVLDVGIAKNVNSAYWYKLTPQEPAIKDAWNVEYLSLLTNKSATWKGDQGTRIEPAY